MKHMVSFAAEFSTTLIFRKRAKIAGAGSTVPGEDHTGYNFSPADASRATLYFVVHVQQEVQIEMDGKLGMVEAPWTVGV